MTISRNNNFDLIRLLAAFQVLIWHGAVHFDISEKVYNYLLVLYHFPGVPIFFTISGFLISYSLERNNFNLKQYFKNRSLRIFPALWVCTIITAILLLSFGKVGSLKDFITWFIAQISFFQFYASESLKQWGTGHPNGSLWSIAVELQFYLVLPILLYIINIPQKKIYVNLLLAILFIISILVKYYVHISPLLTENVVYEKLFNNTVINYLHFFLTGIIIYKNFDIIFPILKEKVLIWLLIYAAFVLVFKFWLKYYDTNYEINIWGITANTILSLLTLSFAFSYTDLSKKLLHENDISYGIYIYHMPIVNTMVSLGYTGSILNLLVLSIITLVIAYFSWKLIEQKILKLKM
ncbi:MULTISPECIES: acyltransferase [Emticicia]|uniref:acyltransferase family protein n=1 Tax=Emticicia TaxID=312278 RepID=UPI0007D8B45C|nr:MULTISPECIES: acyltransferase [Emticicia]